MHLKEANWGQEAQKTDGKWKTTRTGPQEPLGCPHTCLLGMVPGARKPPDVQAGGLPQASLLTKPSEYPLS